MKANKRGNTMLRFNVTIEVPESYFTDLTPEHRCAELQGDLEEAVDVADIGILHVAKVEVAQADADGSVTIRQRINELVARFGDYTTGQYILERAFVQAHTGETDNTGLVTIGGELPHTFPHAQKIRQQEAEMLARIEKDLNARNGGAK